MPRAARACAAGLLCLLALCLAPAARADSLRFCDRRVELDAAQKDKLLRFGAIVKDALEASGQRLALVARSGLDLGRFDVRYSHAGFSLEASRNTPWSVRQLYYACDEQRPRIFDEGLSGFVLGTNDPRLGFVSVVLLPAGPAAAALERTVLDNRQALEFLGPAYSANAYPFSERYQNCNQWVVELLAEAWGGLDEGSQTPRAQAQHWLQREGYVPSVFEVGSRLMMGVAAFIPWLHRDDHPPDDLNHQRFQVSMPASIEAFVHARLPDAVRMEFCHTAHRVVVRRGWQPLPDDCSAGPQDQVIAID